MYYFEEERIRKDEKFKEAVCGGVCAVPLAILIITILGQTSVWPLIQGCLCR